ncbi:hypothetical protein B0H15DRAFT_982644 [Mycena belliarum]|uniref:DUF6534 domain-containing protein n=1 Tax=Mycena belliarum TaxID=1033014 RepID=A0AAD6U2J9_9AGAR|nr:hypothetical protein B0H15DRAFT_982644 [Mycena belliae]
MSAATLQFGAPLDNTMGSMLLGVLVSAVLYGISLLQCLFYFTRYHRDPLYLKSLVAATVVLDSFHLAFVAHTVYHYLITNYYKNDTLHVMVWSVSLEALPTFNRSSFLHHSLQSINALQILRVPCLAKHVLILHRLADKADLITTVSHENFFLTGTIMVLVLATSACGTAWVVLALRAGTYENLLKISPLTNTINALSTAADVIITTTLCYMLRQSRPASLETETMINRLILFTINTGLLTSLCAIASLVSLIASPRTLIYASFYFCIGRLYSNSLLASLNARTVIRGRINDIDTNFHNKSVSYPARARLSLSRDVFARPTDDACTACTELSIQVQRTTTMCPDDAFDGKRPPQVQSENDSISAPEPDA